MLNVEEWMDIKLLLKQGVSQREISRRTGLSRNTVARFAVKAARQPYARLPRGSILDPFKPYLRERFQACPLSAVRFLDEIRPMGYTGRVHLLREFLATLRTEQRRKTLATVRFETPPGEQAQVDWCHCGSFTDPLGQPVKVYAFVMVLGFSRMTYVEFTTSMELAELLRGHQEAFAFFGGWPKEVLYDNMAQVRLPHSAAWNPLFLDFAQHYGFTPRTCRVRRPRTKGKVERTIGYLQENFLAGRSFADLAELNAQGQHWLSHTANVRVHATTGKRPVDLLPQEGLTPWSAARPYPLSRRSARKVSAEGLVHLDRSCYSVPPEHVGRTVLVEEGGTQIRIHCGDLIIAEHRRAERPGQQVITPEHAAALWQLSTGGATPPPARETPSFQLTFQQGVAATPLSVYEALV
jgi:transposase